MNPDLDVRCPLCLAILPKWSFNTHLFNHHLIRTDVGIKHQKPLLQSFQENQLANVSILSSVPDVELSVSSRQGHDSNFGTIELLDDKNFKEALRVLNAG